MHCLLDTNILLRGIDRRHPQSRIVQRAIIELWRKNARLSLVSQTLIEFWAVVTRPVDANGLGMSPPWAEAQLSRMRLFFDVYADVPEILSEWERLVVQHQVIGKKTHDARLVAAMYVHGMSHILTFNGPDFSRYSGITVVDPHSVTPAE